MLPTVYSLEAERDEGVGEKIATLLEGGRFRLERIHSFGAASEPGFWYDQEEPEWVLLVKGTAAVEFEEGTLELGAGDGFTIPAHQRHRVVRTSSDAVWLALHFEA